MAILLCLQSPRILIKHGRNGLYLVHAVCSLICKSKCLKLTWGWWLESSKLFISHMCNAWAETIQRLNSTGTIKQGFSQCDGWVLRERFLKGSYQKTSNSREPESSCMTSYYLTSEVTQHHSCYTPLVEIITRKHCERICGHFLTDMVQCVTTIIIINNCPTSLA